jgi:GAF domain-containing protein
VLAVEGPEAAEHRRIPVGQGIAAPLRPADRVVDDVNADPRYLSCFPQPGRVVVPIGHEGRVVGEIDIDSDRPAAFGEDDSALLERVALLISPYSLVVHNPD